jgi:hypothetical protein
MFEEMSQILLTNKKQGKLHAANIVMPTYYVFSGRTTYLYFNGKVDEPLTYLKKKPAATLILAYRSIHACQ